MHKKPKPRFITIYILYIMAIKLEHLIANINLYTILIKPVQTWTRDHWETEYNSNNSQSTSTALNSTREQHM